MGCIIWSLWVLCDEDFGLVTHPQQARDAFIVIIIQLLLQLRHVSFPSELSDYFETFYSILHVFKWSALFENKSGIFQISSVCFFVVVFGAVTQSVESESWIRFPLLVGLVGVSMMWPTETKIVLSPLRLCVKMSDISVEISAPDSAGPSSDFILLTPDLSAMRRFLFVCLFGFLTSSSTTRLYRGRVPRLTSDNFTCCHTWDRVGRTWLLSQHVILYCHRPNQ